VLLAELIQIRDEEAMDSHPATSVAVKGRRHLNLLALRPGCPLDAGKSSRLLLWSRAWLLGEQGVRQSPVAVREVRGGHHCHSGGERFDRGAIGLSMTVPGDRLVSWSAKALRANGIESARELLTVGEWPRSG
jgi:hypothetical protein